MLKQTLKLSLLMLLLLTGIFSCKKNEDATPTETAFVCTTCSNTPDAVAAQDNKSGGVYKGTVVGSTGTITIKLANGNNIIVADIVFDNKKYNLTSANLASWASGQAITEATFTDNTNGISFKFSVNADGSNPKITAITIPGHPGAKVEVAKETSTNQTKIFEGTYIKLLPTKIDPLGTFNLVMKKDSFSIAAKDSPRPDRPNPEVTLITGGVVKSDGTFELTFKTTTIKGKVVGDSLTGTWTGQGTILESGTIAAKRTL